MRKDSRTCELSWISVKQPQAYEKGFAKIIMMFHKSFQAFVTRRSFPELPGRRPFIDSGRHGCRDAGVDAVDASKNPLSSVAVGSLGTKATPGHLLPLQRLQIELVEVEGRHHRAVTAWTALERMKN